MDEHRATPQPILSLYFKTCIPLDDFSLRTLFFYCSLIWFFFSKIMSPDTSVVAEFIALSRSLSALLCRKHLQFPSNFASLLSRLISFLVQITRTH